MKRTLLLGSMLVGLATAAHASLVLPLSTSNDLGNSGPGPYGTVTVSLTSPTTASFNYSAASGFSFGDVGANINAAAFTSGPISFTARAGDSQTPSYTTLINGSGGQAQLDGFGNFTLIQNDQPNGFSSSVTALSFTITDTSGTWANVNQVLTNNSLGHEVGTHAFNIANGGNSFFDTNGPGVCTGADCGPNPPPPPPPPTDTPEPMSLLLLGSGLFGLGMVRKFTKSS
jgi:hypothetical protein